MYPYKNKLTFLLVYISVKTNLLISNKIIGIMTY